jgi:hypothetical protein
VVLYSVCDNYRRKYCVIVQSTSILQVHLCITYDYNKYLYNSAISEYPYIHTTSPHMFPCDMAGKEEQYVCGSEAEESDNTGEPTFGGRVFYGTVSS